MLDGFNAISSTGNHYTLIDSAKAASLVSDTSAGNSGNFTTRTIVTTNAGTCLDVDFDYTAFNKHQIVEGQALVKFGVGHSAGGNLNLIVTARIRKWDGTTETEIANAVSETFTIADGAQATASLLIDIAKTNFTKGDQLRVSIVMTSTNNGETFKFAHNPRDAAGIDVDAGNTRFVVAVPFRQEI